MASIAPPAHMSSPITLNPFLLPILFAIFPARIAVSAPIAIRAIPPGFTRAKSTLPENIRFNRSPPKEKAAQTQRADLCRVTTLFIRKTEPLRAARGAPRTTTPFTMPSPKRPSPVSIPNGLSACEPFSLLKQTDYSSPSSTVRLYHTLRRSSIRQRINVTLFSPIGCASLLIAGCPTDIAMAK